MLNTTRRAFISSSAASLLLAGTAQAASLKDAGIRFYWHMQKKWSLDLMAGSINGLIPFDQFCQLCKELEPHMLYVSLRWIRNQGDGWALQYFKNLSFEQSYYVSEKLLTAMEDKQIATDLEQLLDQLNASPTLLVDKTIETIKAARA